MEIDTQVVSAARSTAASLDGSGDTKEVGLKGEMRKALEAGAPRLEVGASEWSPRLAGWPKVGGVDLAVFESVGADSTVAAIELKWGAGTLYNTIWDALKLATVVSERDVRGFMIAGAPVAEWEPTAPSCSLMGV